jgi:hypothetical protein
MQKQKTHKLFYNKWTHKIQCEIKGAWSVNTLILKMINNNNSFKDVWIPRDTDGPELKKFVKAWTNFKGQDLQVRSEYTHFNVFCNDAGLVKKIKTTMKPWIVGITEPANKQEYEFLTSNSSKKVLCDNFPKGKYQYRIYLNTKMPFESRTKFYEWAIRYGDQFNISNTTINWLIGKKYYMQDPFFYIENGPLLTMIGLYLGNNLKRIEEFIPRSNINTECPT